ncbi:class I SAM-dependent methyltransferase [Dysgonomonas sp. ZJ279]|uniref:class I SAM-dependent methyltransferase n=1 Tax=Dysgonomonas sp. ZJ279 TaxID=2709796 RepID=UPI0013EB070E|nr:class I SAM-dependent methyltransferase [Dysgonomonas sp. ZJ279]
MDNKSTIEDIRKRFDKDVERFSNLETGQVSTIDANISLELITESAKRLRPQAENLLDVGCGAGNYTLKMLSKLPDLNCTLLDLSLPMLEKAQERVSAETKGTVEIVQGDLRKVELPVKHYDIILAGAVLHHLRDESDWLFTFSKLHRLLKPGGCLMISDLIVQDSDVLTAYIWEKYSDYLIEVAGEEYKNKVLEYIEIEDSPRSLNFQLDLMKNTGFRKVEVLHKNLCFAAYGGIK